MSRGSLKNMNLMQYDLCFKQMCSKNNILRTFQKHFVYTHEWCYSCACVRPRKCTRDLIRNAWESYDWARPNQLLSSGNSLYIICRNCYLLNCFKMQHIYTLYHQWGNQLADGRVVCTRDRCYHAHVRWEGIESDLSWKLSAIHSFRWNGNWVIL